MSDDNTQGGAEPSPASASPPTLTAAERAAILEALAAAEQDERLFGDKAAAADAAALRGLLERLG